MYFPKTYHNNITCLLYEWFRDDVSTDFNLWYEWFNDHSVDAKDIQANATWLEKQGDQVLFRATTDLRAYVYRGKPIPEKNIISMPIKNAIQLVHAWERILETCPAEIIIIEENGIYRLEEVQ
jgi:hypothetical protein